MIENTMTDYNDGNWHGWNGGECPVHPKSVVDAVWPSGMDDKKSYRNARKAKDFPWIVGGALTPFLFRVTKPYVELPKPREFWVNEYPHEIRTMHNSKEDADAFTLTSLNRIRCIRVREVIEE